MNESLELKQVSTQERSQELSDAILDHFVELDDLYGCLDDLLESFADEDLVANADSLERVAMLIDGLKKMDPESFDEVIVNIARRIKALAVQGGGTVRDFANIVEDFVEHRKYLKLLLVVGLSEKEAKKMESCALEAILLFGRSIMQSVHKPENFLGNGAVAEVYSIDGDGYQDDCIKLIIHQDMYEEGNNVHEEARFLYDLNNFSVEGVRSPSFKQVLSGGDVVGIVMEKLNAVSLSLVKQGQQKLPECFDIDDFFSSLHSYITALHEEREVSHGDLALRNIMCDSETGKPYVIDFGKSINKRDSAIGKGDRWDGYCAHDLAAVKGCKYDLQQVLTG